jgi:chromosomal replication initiator protein
MVKDDHKMDESAKNIWESAQEKLRTMLKKDLYELWFAPIRAVSVADKTFTLGVANDFCGFWLKDNYLSLIQDVLAFVTGRQLKVVFAVAELPETLESIAPEVAESAPKPSPEQPAPVTVRSTARSPLNGDPSFNPNNTFDSFIIGENNKMAHAASVAVAQSPGKAYNPLFLYSGVGLGKTHLLQAIGQYVVAHRKRARVTYLSCERFMNEFVEALKDNKLTQFRKHYRQTDVLLIDDIQFLAGKERTQEEFFHTFNALHEGQKQIVLTCDRPSNEIQNLENRLLSRFEWGMVADLQPPDIEVRLAILRRKAELMNANLPDEILDFLAYHIRANIRRLEGALTRVVAHAKLLEMDGKPLTLEGVEKLLHAVLHEESRDTVTMDIIQKKVADHFDLRLADMSSRRRPENIAFPRQIAMYLSRHLTDHSLNSIGEAFGGRDHGTVMHACKLVKDRMEVDDNVRQKVNYLESLLLR